MWSGKRLVSWAATVAVLWAGCEALAQPSPPPSVALEAATWMRAGEPERALAYLDSLIGAGGDHFEAHVVRGHAHLQLGERDAAKADFEHAQALEPERPEAHHGLGLVAFERVKEAERALLTLGKLFGRNPEKTAKRHFEKALELEPEFDDAAIALAELHLNRGRHRDLEAALTLLQGRMSGYRLNDVLYALSRALLKLGRLGEAENVLAQLLARAPTHNGGLLRLCELYGELESPEQLSIAFRRLTESLADPEVTQELRVTMRPVASREFLERFDSAAAPGTVLRRYWNQHDPTPTTLVNERLYEHQRRVLEARRAYGVPGPVGFDDRGRIYVRLGAPTEAFVSGGSGTNRANESWVYRGLSDSPITYDFVDKGGGAYELTADLGDALMAFSLAPSDRLTALQELFQERQHLHSNYARTANDLVLMRDNVAGSVSRETFDTRAAILEYTRAAENLQAKAPPAAYRPPAGLDQLAGAMVLARLRGHPGSGRVELAYGVPTGELETASGQSEQVVLEESFALYDAAYEEVARARRQRAVDLSGSGADHSYVGLVAIPPKEALEFLPAGEYRLAFAVRDVHANRSKEFAVRFHLPEYAADTLSMSDLQWSVAGGDANAFRPHPYRTVAATEPLFVRYEIYGLGLAADQLTDFGVTYAVAGADGALKRLLGRLNPLGRAPAGGIELGAARRGTTPEEVDVVELDLAGLDPGTYTLTVTVDDQVAGSSAEAACTLEIAGQP